MGKKLDLSKPVQTRSGLRARVICADRKGYSKPIMALVSNDAGNEICRSYTPEGKVYVDAAYSSGLDLVNVPERRELWLNLYPPHPSAHGVNVPAYTSREAADLNAIAGRVACIKVEFTEGEGLE